MIVHITAQKYIIVSSAPLHRLTRPLQAHSLPLVSGRPCARQEHDAGCLRQSRNRDRTHMLRCVPGALRLDGGCWVGDS